MLEKCENVKGSIKMLGRVLWQVQENWIGREDDEEEKKAYENKCILEDAIEDAKENGYSSGYNSGYDSGKSDGISNEKINIAKNLISMNMALEDISKATGLTIDEINNLK